MRICTAHTAYVSDEPMGVPHIPHMFLMNRWARGREMEPHECDEVVDVGDRHGARGELRGRVVDVGAVLG